MSKEFVILVDRDDSPIGMEEKVKCHLPDGRLHRAFTALLFDVQGNLVLTKRAKEKMLWPGDWDGTFASHPREGETYVSSAERRMPEELGISEKLDYLHKFEYHVPYKDIGSENEVCGALIGVTKKAQKLQKIKGEIDEIKLVSAKDLLSEINERPESYCPWMLIALEFLEKSNKSTLKKYEDTLSVWMSSQMREGLPKAISAHMSDDKWRFINEKNQTD